jgi:hypothetical protein
MGHAEWEDSSAWMPAGQFGPDERTGTSEPALGRGEHQGRKFFKQPSRMTRSFERIEALPL